MCETFHKRTREGALFGPDSCESFFWAHALLIAVLDFVLMAVIPVGPNGARLMGHTVLQRANDIEETEERPRANELPLDSHDLLYSAMSSLSTAIS